MSSLSLRPFLFLRSVLYCHLCLDTDLGLPIKTAIGIFFIISLDVRPLEVEFQLSKLIKSLDNYMLTCSFRLKDVEF